MGRAMTRGEAYKNIGKSFTKSVGFGTIASRGVVFYILRVGRVCE